jgi:hypothetical protein
MHLHRNAVESQKVLGRLYTITGTLICTGGAQLNADGEGFFVPEVGARMGKIDESGNWIVRTTDGDTIRVTNLREAPATASLPRRYLFEYRAQNSPAPNWVLEDFPKTASDSNSPV